jgi:hypothetical protein
LPASDIVRLLLIPGDIGGQFPQGWLPMSNRRLRRRGPVSRRQANAR